MKHYTTFDRINSVSTTSAQNTTLCVQTIPQFNAIESKIIACMSLTSLSDLDKIVIDLLFTNGLRISEVLQIHSNNIDARGNVFIKGLKGSNDRLAQVTFMRSQLLSLRSAGCQLFEYNSRFYYYRLFKKLGLYITYGSGENKAVTHSLRHAYIFSVQSLANDINSTASIVGHKNSKSTNHYYSKDAKNQQKKR